MRETRIDNIINIIRTLNDGSVLPDQDDTNTKKDLYSELVQLFISEIDKKYYFFATFNVDEKDYQVTNMGEIENTTIRNTEAYKLVDPPTPNSSYLILFWEVATISVLFFIF